MFNILKQGVNEMTDDATSYEMQCYFNKLNVFHL